MRTTISIDLPLLAKIREISHREHKKITRVIQELLSLGVSARSKSEAAPSPFAQWHSKKMGARMDYADKEALHKILDQRP